MNKFGNPSVFHGDVRCEGKTTLAGAVVVSGALTNSGAQTFTGNVSISGTTAFTGNVTLAGNKQLSFAGVTPGTETAGSCMTTGSTWVSHTAAGACAIKFLCANAATSGDYATMRIRGRADAVSSGGTEGINVSASSTIANYGDLCAGYFAAQPGAVLNNSASNIITAIHAVVDRTTASDGRTWVAWIDTHATTKSGAGDYLMRFSHNGTVANDGMLTIYNGGRMPQFINFEDVAGFLSTSSSGTFTKTHKVAVKIAGDATQYYIEMGTVI